jgi:nucleoside-diphosphate-sugar epimerase
MSPDESRAAGPVAAMPTEPPHDVEELEERLSRPDDGVVGALRRCPGDVLVLGAGGKMGPSLARMIRRAADAIGDGRRVLAASRFGDGGVEGTLRDAGVETIRCDLLDDDAVRRLPSAPNVFHLAGQKFGTSAAPAATWGANVVIPTYAAERYHDSRLVVLSTGNVYPLVPAGGPGAHEETPPAPVGEYALSCLARERIVEFFSMRHGTPAAIVRLNYAVDLRYGVLVDVARKVREGLPVDVTMGWANVIWQGDANRRIARALAHTERPPLVLNLTGLEVVSIRDAADRFGRRFGRAPHIVGREAPDALLSDARRAAALFGPPAVPLDRLIDWVGGWLERGGPLLEKPTHYEERTGRF